MSVIFPVGWLCRALRLHTRHYENLCRGYDLEPDAIRKNRIELQESLFTRDFLRKAGARFFASRSNCWGSCVVPGNSCGRACHKRHSAGGFVAVFGWWSVGDHGQFVVPDMALASQFVVPDLIRNPPALGAGFKKMRDPGASPGRRRGMAEQRVAGYAASPAAACVL